MRALVRAPAPTWDGGRRVVVLLYHSVHPSKRLASATPAMFEDHMTWLTEHCDVIALDHVLASAAGPRRDRPRVAITFDDGYADVFEFALPILSHLGLSATFFLTVGLTEGDPTVIRRMADLQAASPGDVQGLSWSQVLEMRDAGMAFGSHGVHHLNLARADDASVRVEAMASKQRIEDQLGSEVRLFAYPFGKPKHHFDQRTMGLVASCGYRMAYTTTFGRVRATTDPMAIPRFSITMDAVEMVEAKVKGRLDLVGAYQRYAPSWAGRLISPETSVTT